jgi:hypothetical protein
VKLFTTALDGPGRRDQPCDHDVNDVARKTIGEWKVCLEESVVGRPKEEVERYFGVRGRRYLASRNSTFEHHVVMFAQGANEAVPPDDRQRGVTLHFADEFHEGSTGRCPLDRSNPRSQRAEEVTAQGSGVHEMLRREEMSEERVEGQGALGLPPPVNGRFAHARSDGDIFDGERLEALLLEQLSGCFEDCLFGVLGPWTPASRTLGVARLLHQKSVHLL